MSKKEKKQFIFDPRGDLECSMTFFTYLDKILEIEKDDEIKNYAQERWGYTNRENQAIVADMIQENPPY